ncbi:hypothetical protein GLAREA_09798 [Glarea lozoyensis ATCC 20868]|uniref:Trichothecene 3-O-acetyltransferase-like N-terminal domain-containing protein n=1 Tax=Glarea lozoyensis (strain ATCC 20868 / MF5171) TaxID=1116229 RepID=S3CQD4_GLAL2|nr:uncharacterized protein GLAREA_09798 [Glarea lozoyensis ATCC 20868]EPE28677.1 hypothetical protein GLAREA_09798 [Glarea lozoyensis ATCC 20868]
MDDLEHIRDDIGQLSRLKTYTHVLLCFPIPDTTTRESITNALRNAALELTSSFPWLAAKVVNEGSGMGNSGVFKLAQCPQFAPPNSIVQVKDCSHICPTYEDIIRSRGPFEMLDGKVLAPCVAFPEIHAESTESDPACVIAIQANYIQGGLLLDAATQHNFIDGNGLFQCLRLLAKAMCGQKFSNAEIEQGNRDRRTLIPLLRPNEGMLDHSHLKRQPLPATSRPTQSPTKPAESAAWCCFRFSGAKLKELKHSVNKDLGRNAVASSITYVSTNDALSGFLWKCLSAIRLKRRQQPNDFSKFSRALDARRAMQVPKEYMGQMGYNATCRISFGDLEKMSLREVCALLRETVQTVNNEYSVRSWVTFIANEPDKSTIMFGGTFNPDTDIGLSSLAHAELYSVEFGALGKPQLVRRPNFGPLESIVYFWPQTEDGDIDVLMCLSGMDLQGMKEDGVWMSFANFIG